MKVQSRRRRWRKRLLIGLALLFVTNLVVPRVMRRYAEGLILDSACNGWLDAPRPEYFTGARVLAWANIFPLYDTSFDEYWMFSPCLGKSLLRCDNAQEALNEQWDKEENLAFARQTCEAWRETFLLARSHRITPYYAMAHKLLRYPEQMCLPCEKLGLLPPQPGAKTAP